MPSFIDRPILHLTEQDSFTPRHAFEGVAIFGSIGSGKTSGSGKNLALNYLRSGFGGVVMCAKEEEYAQWQEYCEKTGRAKDLYRIGAGSNETFNFLDYESKRKDSGAGITHNIASTLMTVMKAGEPEGDEKDKSFWDGTMRSLLIHAIDLCNLNKKELLFKDISAVIKSAPTSLDEVKDIQWRSQSLCFKMMKKASDIINSLIVSNVSDQMYLKLRKVEDFFLTTWVNLSPKTRSIVEQIFLNFSHRFLSEPLNRIFCSGTTIRPEDTQQGKVIVLDLPYLIYEQAGRDGQILFKYIWQRAMQRRKIDETSRPVFLWADEAHLFLHEHDVDHQSTARSFRASTIYISQNLPNYYIHAGAGQQGRNRIEALLGNMGTKIFHANSCIQTNQYAADTVGKIRTWQANQGSSYGEQVSHNQGISETVEYVIQPSEFATLKTGGEMNNFITEAIIHRQGAPFKFSKTNYVRKYFSQNI
ncbi:TraM recognition domain-containing protein [uncultured Roseivirga sp.]|uniref:type IV secretory system conjugative DNA transfer family protein n=1 Tax=uncultured Roseivirga sp. TaxID=543088 RepID=UPI0030DBC167|tara:strand:- start:59858 stop:61279 length:1422 start_codon:yes stop_codon:yes gene_type:complete